MERREQGTTGYRNAKERQPVRNTMQTNASGPASGAGYANAMGQTAARQTATVGTMSRNTRQMGPDSAIRQKAASETNARAVKASGKPDIRLLLISLMGIFVLGAMGWGICQHVKGINTRGEMTTYEAVQGLKKIEDNTENAGKTIDVDKLIQKILDNVVFDAELNKLDESVAEGMVEITEGTKLQFYAGNGIYADELIVMTAKNEEDAKKNQENVKIHLSETKKAFQDYIPEEAGKIDNAVSIRCGCYVIVCITSDYEKAEKTIHAMIQE